MSFSTTVATSVHLTVVAVVQSGDLRVDGGYILDDSLHHGSHGSRFDRVQPISGFHGLPQHLRNRQALNSHVVIQQVLSGLLKVIAYLRRGGHNVLRGAVLIDVEEIVGCRELKNIYLINDKSKFIRHRTPWTETETL